MTYVTNYEGPNVTRYCILEHDGEPASGLTRTVPLHGQCEDGAVTLWHIPKRALGLFLGLAEYNVVSKSSNPALYEVFSELCWGISCDRDLPIDCEMEGFTSTYAAFLNIQSRRSFHYCIYLAGH